MIKLLTCCAASFLLAAAPAFAQTNYVPGNSLCVGADGKTLDVCSPLYSPPAGNYAVLYTNSAQPRKTDDFSILLCGAQNKGPVTYTMPQSSSSVFPPGHQVTIKNDSTSEATPGICTIAPAAGKICGAPGVVSGIPSATCGPITLLPGGEVSLIGTGSNYLAFSFAPGTWHQFANNVAALQWTGLSGYYGYNLTCFGVTPATNSDPPVLHVAVNNGAFETAGYTQENTHAYRPSNSGGGGTTNLNGYQLAPGGNNNSQSYYGEHFNLDITTTYGTGAGYIISFLSAARGTNGVTDVLGNFAGTAPWNTNGPLTGLEVRNAGSGSNLTAGSCYLKPLV